MLALFSFKTKSLRSFGSDPDVDILFRYHVFVLEDLFEGGAEFTQRRDDWRYSARIMYLAG